MQKKTTNNKLTKKQYISKYIFLKILFGEFQIGDLVYSESSMSKLFNTTNATVRVAYNNLIQRGILKPQKGKGYIVLKNIGSYMFDQYENLTKLISNHDKNIFYFYLNNKKIADLSFISPFIDEKTTINVLLDVFKIVFSKLEIEEITLNKSYSHNKEFLINEYHYLWNNKEVLSLKLRCNLQHIDIFNYKKNIALK